VVKVTLEVPESLLGEIYLAVGHVLDDWDEADQGPEQAADSEPSDGDQAPEES
jgi:hypothetical protein